MKLHGEGGLVLAEETAVVEADPRRRVLVAPDDYLRRIAVRVEVVHTGDPRRDPARPARARRVRGRLGSGARESGAGAIGGG